jgi:hypothetical protein
LRTHALVYRSLYQRQARARAVCASSGIRIMNEGFGQSELANRQSEIPQSSFGWGDDTLILRLVKQRGRRIRGLRGLSAASRQPYSGETTARRQGYDLGAH